MVNRVIKHTPVIQTASFTKAWLCVRHSLHNTTLQKHTSRLKLLETGRHILHKANKFRHVEMHLTQRSFHNAYK